MELDFTAPENHQCIKQSSKTVYTDQVVKVNCGFLSRKIQ